jgi:nitrite reductase/ring-hydroxylating ferredoxin subunit
MRQGADSMAKDDFVFAAELAELATTGIKTVQRSGHTIVLVRNNGALYAVDNRCPHMGFPLDKGTVQDGILTCHWHHARFDLTSGGTFDQFADDVRVFPVEVRNGEIWIDLQEERDLRVHQQDRLRVGLERDIPLVIGKAVLMLTEGAGDPVDPFRTGLEFGTRYRSRGWGQGLTMHACFMNLLPALGEAQRPRALYHGLSAVARDSFGQPARFCVRPLPGATPDLATLKRWFRQFIEVRDDEGAERCIVSAVQAGYAPAQLADMLFAAVTDHRYIDLGHPADFTNKALEALDIAGWEQAELVLTSLVGGYAAAERMEESNAWRHPIDLVAMLEAAFEQLPATGGAGQNRQVGPEANSGTVARRAHEAALVEMMLGDDPAATIEAMLTALRAGMAGVDLAQTVAYAAALRIARFHTSNEFGDWDTALHTFTFANAIHQGMRRAPSVELLRGVFDGAMSVYLDRFLNIPAARIPEPTDHAEADDATLHQLSNLLDRQQQVHQAAQALANYASTGATAALLAQLGALLLREDRDFHTIQCVEAALRQHALLADRPTAQVHVLTAAIRYLAAHAPTVRAQEQTYRIALRLHRGEELFEG